ncbi:MAG: hypothetical protein R3F17_00270 [Planctomycetota bacterium]
MRAAISMAGLYLEDIDLVSTHATSTPLGDVQGGQAVRAALGERAHPDQQHQELASSHDGAAGALELAGNLPSLQDGETHHQRHRPDPGVRLAGLVLGEPVQRPFRTPR